MRSKRRNAIFIWINACIFLYTVSFTLIEVLLDLPGQNPHIQGPKCINCLEIFFQDCKKKGKKFMSQSIGNYCMPSLWTQSLHCFSFPVFLGFREVDKNHCLFSLLDSSFGLSLGCSLTKYCNRLCCLTCLFLIIWRQWRVPHDSNRVLVKHILQMTTGSVSLQIRETEYPHLVFSSHKGTGFIIWSPPLCLPLGSFRLPSKMGKAQEKIPTLTPKLWC